MMGRKNHLSKIKRLLQIQQLLQEEPSYDAEQLASLLDVSKRTIHRDLSALQALGVEVQFSRQEGYQIQNAATSAPVLKPEEKLLVEIALQALPDASQHIYRDIVQSIHRKLEISLLQDYSNQEAPSESTPPSESSSFTDTPPGGS